MAKVLLLTTATLRLVTASGEAHHHGDNDGDLDGTNDSRDQDVMQLLATRNDVEDVKVQ